MIPSKKICGDCFCNEGELHEVGCDQEKCPNCGSQLISCGCFMYYRIYDCMEQIPNREPHFAETSSCARCGKKEPDMKMVDLKDWEDICGSTYDVRSMLCSECMDFIIKKRNLIIGRHKEVRK